MPITKSEAPSGGSGGVADVPISGNAGGTQLTAAPTFGTGPYTYQWAMAQNIEQRFISATQTQVPSTPTNLAVLGITITGPIDSYGTSVMWKCEVTDSLGAKGVGYFTNVSPSG